MPVSQRALTVLRERATAELEAGGWQCLLERPAGVTQNDMGEEVEGATPEQLGPFACKLVATPSAVGRERFRESLQGVGLLTSWQVVLPWGTPADNVDTVRITSPAPERVFEVQQVAGPKTNGIRLILYVEEAS